MTSTNDAEVCLSGWVLGRKLFSFHGNKGISRHWATWKKRYCAIEDGCFWMGSTEDRLSWQQFPLGNSSVKRHFYSLQGHRLVIFFHQNISHSNDLEISLQFFDETEINKWHEALNKTIYSLLEAKNRTTENALGDLSNFINEKIKLKKNAMNFSSHCYFSDNEIAIANTESESEGKLAIYEDQQNHEWGLWKRNNYDSVIADAMTSFENYPVNTLGTTIVDYTVVTTSASTANEPDGTTTRFTTTKDPVDATSVTIDNNPKDTTRFNIIDNPVELIINCDPIDIDATSTTPVDVAVDEGSASSVSYPVDSTNNIPLSLSSLQLISSITETNLGTILPKFPLEVDSMLTSSVIYNSYTYSHMSINDQYERNDLSSDNVLINNNTSIGNIYSSISSCNSSSSTSSSTSSSSNIPLNNKYSISTKVYNDVNNKQEGRFKNSLITNIPNNQLYNSSSSTSLLQILSNTNATDTVVIVNVIMDMIDSIIISNSSPPADDDQSTRSEVAIDLANSNNKKLESTVLSSSSHYDDYVDDAPSSRQLPIIEEIVGNEIPSIVFNKDFKAPAISAVMDTSTIISSTTTTTTTTVASVTKDEVESLLSNSRYSQHSSVILEIPLSPLSELLDTALPTPSSYQRDLHLQLLSSKSRLTNNNNNINNDMDCNSKVSSTQISDNNIFSQVPIPKLKIVIMVVGTRGDVQPFSLIGKRLKSDGHRVRLATHECFRDFVLSQGLEFFPLAGDPLKLSEFMVKSQGFIMPTTWDGLKEIPVNLSMLSDIIDSCWTACVEADPLDPQHREFVADAIISNPVTYGHIHCAEALGIPLHLMFPQPWTPTKAFPHPLSCMSYETKWSKENELSYQFVDRMLWVTIESAVNRLRKRIGLPPIRTGEEGWDILNYNKVPFAKMWSPSLAPKPVDWGDHIDVIGSVCEPSPVLKELSLLLHPCPCPPSESQGEYTQSLSPTVPPPTICITTTPSSNSTDESIVTGFKEQPSPLRIPTVPPVPASSECSSEVYTPPASLIEFLAAGPPPIFVGFGSMVCADPVALIRIILRGAAKAGVRVIWQEGWSAITVTEFQSLVQEAAGLSESKCSNSSTTEAIITEDIASRNKTTEILDQKRDQFMGSFLNRWRSKSVIESPDHQHLNKELETDILDETPVSALSDYDNFSAVGGDGGDNNNEKEILDADAEAYLFEISIEDNNQLCRPWRESDAYLLGSVPHTWLFQHVAAVIHHGGAGTTAAGLRAGKPTFVVPFFGDQHFWGEMVSRNVLGPPPCPVNKLTVDKVAEAMQVLISLRVVENVAMFSTRLAMENGLKEAVDSFYRHLPLPAMLCDVSIFKGESRLAVIYCPHCGMKMCKEVDLWVHRQGSGNEHHEVAICDYVHWKVRSPTDPVDGIIQGLGGATYEFREGITEAISLPIQAAFTEGVYAVPGGMIGGLRSLLGGPVTGGYVFYNKIGEGLFQTLGNRKANKNSKWEGSSRSKILIRSANIGRLKRLLWTEDHELKVVVTNYYDKEDNVMMIESSLTSDNTRLLPSLSAGLLLEEEEEDENGWMLCSYEDCVSDYTLNSHSTNIAAASRTSTTSSSLLLHYNVNDRYRNHDNNNSNNNNKSLSHVKEAKEYQRKEMTWNQNEEKEENEKKSTEAEADIENSHESHQEIEQAYQYILSINEALNDILSDSKLKENISATTTTTSTTTMSKSMEPRNMSSHLSSSNHHHHHGKSHWGEYLMNILLQPMTTFGGGGGNNNSSSSSVGNMVDHSHSGGAPFPNTTTTTTTTTTNTIATAPLNNNINNNSNSNSNNNNNNNNNNTECNNQMTTESSLPLLNTLDTMIITSKNMDIITSTSNNNNINNNSNNDNNYNNNNNKLTSLNNLSQLLEFQSLHPTLLYLRLQRSLQQNEKSDNEKNDPIHRKVSNIHTVRGKIFKSYN